MARPAETIRNAAQAVWPGASVAERGRNYIIHAHPTEPGRFMTTIVMEPLHIRDTETEINSDWSSTTGAWQYQMITADYHAFSRDQLGVGTMYRYQHPGSGEFVEFQPLALNWVNDSDSRQQITQPQSVVGQVVNGDILRFPNGYGTGRHFEYQTQTGRLVKILTIDSLANLPTPTVTGTPHLEIEFIISKSAGVTEWINGQQWDRSTRTQTAGKIEYRNSQGAVLWALDVPRAWDSDGNQVIGLMTLRRQGANRFVTVRVPKAWIDSAVFPIFLDPTFDSQPDATAGLDTWILENSPDTNHVTTNTLSVRPTAGSRRHSLLKFDLSSIPGDATVDSAQLRFRNSSTATGGRTCQLYRILAANSGWTEAGATWNYAVASTTRWAGDTGSNGGTDAGCSVSGTDYNGTSMAALEYVANDPADTESIATLNTTAMEAMIDANHGFLMTIDTNAIFNWHSSDASTESNRPRLVIVYTEAGGSTPLTVADAAVAVTMDAPALTQHNILSTQDAALAVAMDAVALTQHNVLSVDDMAVAVGMDAVTLTPILAVDDLAVGVAVDSVALTQHNVLAVQDVAVAVAMDAPALGVDLVVDDMAIAVAVDAPALTQHNALSVADVAVAVAVDTPALTQHNVLAVDDASVAVSADSPSLAQHNVLAVDDVAVAVAMDNVALGVSGTLGVQEMVVNVAMDAVALTQHHALAVDDMTVAVNAEAVTLTVELIVADMAVAVAVDSPALTQHNILAVDDLAVAVAADNVTLGVAGALDVDDLAIAVAMDSPSLTQHNVLVVDDMAVAVAMDAPTLAIALIVDDMAIAVSIDAPALTQHYALAVDDMAIGVAMGAIALTQHNILAVDDLAIAVAADGVTLDVDQSYEVFHREIDHASNYIIDHEGNYILAFISIDVTPVAQPVHIVQPGALVSLGVNITVDVQVVAIVQPGATVAVGANITVDVQLVHIVQPAATTGVGVDIAVSVQVVAIAQPIATVGVGIDVQASAQIVAIVHPAATIEAGVNILPDPQSVAIVQPQAIVGRGIEFFADVQIVAIVQPAASVSASGLLNINVGVQVIAILQPPATVIIAFAALLTTRSRSVTLTAERDLELTANRRFTLTARRGD